VLNRPCLTDLFGTFRAGAALSRAARWATAHPLDGQALKLHAESTHPGVSYDQENFWDVLGEDTVLRRQPNTRSLQWNASVRTDHCSRSNASCSRHEMWPVMSSVRVWRNVTWADTLQHRTAQACYRTVTEHFDRTSAHSNFHCAGRDGIRSPGFGRCLLED
jgi:hypothetical protein